MNITIVGSGYVGLVAGACFADTGNDVVCVDSNIEKIEGLKRGEIPIYEPGLSDIVLRNVKEGRLSFTTSLQEGTDRSDVIFIAVGTPQDEDGSADLRHVLAVAAGIGKAMKGSKIIVDKSTVPVGTAKKVRAAIAEHTSHPFEVVSNPEFLKEGAAIEDFMKPDRVVVGVESERAAAVMRELYAPFVRTNNPIIVMDVASAEMTKYAANAMLAARVSFMNEIANLCEKVGADVDSVRVGIGTDSRIGMSFLFPGIGYGGSCFPKDVQALIRTASDAGVEFTLSKAVEEVNKAQKQVLVTKVRSHFAREGLSGKHFALWGLAFKPKTDDVREAPALSVCKALLEAGATLSLFDPEATKTFQVALGSQPGVTYAETNYDALKGADALLICTEWNEFRRPNYSRMKELLKHPLIFDGRNILDRKALSLEGFTYYCIGRPEVRPQSEKGAR
jgi:UDPglucose 6-dehydrogenase